jgi:general secretion pathway protein D
MRKLAVLFFTALLLAACASQETLREARIDVEAGNEEQGLAKLAQAVKEHPNDKELRNYYERHKSVATQRYLALGDNARSAGALERAEQSYARALRIDPDNERAKNALAGLQADREQSRVVAEAAEAFKKGDVREAQARVQSVLVQNPQNKEARALFRRIEASVVKQTVTPQLNADLKKPITLEFRDAPLRQVFEIISKQTGLNFIFDKDVPPDAKATIFVRDTSIDEAMRIMLVTNQLDRKVLNDNTVLIYPNTPAKNRDYKDLVVRSFYLANADVKSTAQMVRSLVKTRDLFVDEKLNLLVMRDTPEAIRMAEKLIANQDKSEPEVNLEVEVLEVGENQLRAAGIQWPGQLALGLQGAAGVPGQLTGTEATHMNSGLVRLTVSDPLFALNLREQIGRNNILANPRIRVKNREKARIHIGDKVPVITTTAGATGFVSESVNYLDVGLKLDVEPQVYLEDDVGIKVGLEVSNVSNQIKTNSGTLAYQVGTRNATTTLRLHDGETQVLAGLISNEDRRNSSQVPGLADLPVAGRLFQNREDTANKTEVVLLITPHVVRNVERTDARLEEFNSGTETEVGGGGGGGAGSFMSSQPLTPVPSTPPTPPTPAQPQPAIPSTLGSPAPAAGPAPATGPYPR